MKTSLRIFGIILLALFIMSMSECDRGKDDPPIEDNGNVVHIPDAALRATIAAKLEIQDDTSITVDDMLKLTDLSSGDIDIDIVNLTGLEYATNLESLYLYANGIVDISPLKELTNLKNLSLGNNEIVDISPLKELTNLESLDLEDNGIVDVSPLKELTNLESLYLYANGIVDISPLKELTNLEELGLSGNPLSQESVEIHIPAIEANGTGVNY